MGQQMRGYLWGPISDVCLSPSNLCVTSLSCAVLSSAVNGFTITLTHKRLHLCRNMTVSWKTRWRSVCVPCPWKSWVCHLVKEWSSPSAPSVSCSVSQQFFFLKPQQFSCDSLAVLMRFVCTCVILYEQQNSNFSPDFCVLVSPELFLVMLLFVLLCFFKARQCLTERVTAVSISSHVCCKLLTGNSVAALQFFCYLLFFLQF